MKRFGPPLLLLATVCALSPLPALADLALATARNCMSCHHLDKKVVGPAYKDVAAKYRADKTAPARLATKIIEGGGGAWGVVKMPSNPQVSEAEAKKLATWILSQ
jgi:cytochrome c